MLAILLLYETIIRFFEWKMYTSTIYLHPCSCTCASSFLALGVPDDVMRRLSCLSQPEPVTGDAIRGCCSAPWVVLVRLDTIIALGDVEACRQLQKVMGSGIYWMHTYNGVAELSIWWLSCLMTFVMGLLCGSDLSMDRYKTTYTFLCITLLWEQCLAVWLCFCFYYSMRDKIFCVKSRIDEELWRCCYNCYGGAAVSFSII